MIEAPADWRLLCRGIDRRVFLMHSLLEMLFFYHCKGEIDSNRVTNFAVGFFSAFKGERDSLMIVD